MWYVPEDRALVTALHLDGLNRKIAAKLETNHFAGSCRTITMHWQNIQIVIVRVSLKERIPFMVFDSITNFFICFSH